MSSLPKDENGRPVPWFAAEVDGKPDIQTVRPGGMQEALQFKLCFLCGKSLGRYAAFMLGPMSLLNRIAAEPPCHRDCAQYAAMAGLSPRRASGLELVWVTRRWYMIRDANGQPLFDVGSPDQTYWYADGREAGRDDILESLDSGMPPLRKTAADNGPLAALDLESQYGSALNLVPAS
jgi:hypothetical protein